MKKHTRSSPEVLKRVIGLALLITAFCLIGIHSKLRSDFADSDWQSIVTRVGIILVVSTIVAFRLKSLFDQQHGKPYAPQSYGRFFVSLLFFSVLFFPLISQTSNLQKGAFDITKAIFYSCNKDLPTTVGTVLKEFPDKYQDYISNNSQLNNLLIHLNSYVKIYGLGVSPNDMIALGKNGFYFEGSAERKVERNIREHFDNIADYMGQIPFTEADLRQWKRILEERKYWLKERGIDYAFVLAPSKALVYQEYLPTPLQMTDSKRNRYMQLSAYLQEYADIHFIDTLPPLLEAKRERKYPLLYYKTDWHWNYYGAFIAYQTIIGELRDMLPHHELTSPNLSDFELSVRKGWAHRKFMDLLGLPAQLHKNEHYVVMKPKKGGSYDDAKHIPRDGIKDVYPQKYTLKADDGDTMQIRLVQNPNAPIDSILILGDSFLEMCVLYFSGNAKRVLNYRTIINFPAYIFKFEQPDIVVQGLLNMYLLRPPPENPAEFEKSYMRGKFYENGNNVVTRRSGEDFRVHFRNRQRFYEILFSQANRVGPQEVQIAKVGVEAQQKGQVQFQFFDQDSSVIKTMLLKVDRGHNDLYVELPTGIISKLSCTEYGSATSIIPRNFELRSDLPIRGIAQHRLIP